MNIKQVLSFLLILFILVGCNSYPVKYSQSNIYEGYLIDDEGYLIDDEEFSGFLRCNGESGLSFTDVNNIGVANRYWENRSFIREPVYFNEQIRDTPNTPTSGLALKGSFAIPK
jgi:hypothetical protein